MKSFSLKMLNFVAEIYESDCSLVMEASSIKPGLFGQKHSNRDYSKGQGWGKNQFNSSFPASLVAYMSSLGIQPVYLCLDKHLKVVHKYISGEELFGIDPLSDNLYYSFEASFPPYEKYFIGLRKNEHSTLCSIHLKKARSHFVVLRLNLLLCPTAQPGTAKTRRKAVRWLCGIQQYAMWHVASVSIIRRTNRSKGLESCFQEYPTLTIGTSKTVLGRTSI